MKCNLTSILNGKEIVHFWLWTDVMAVLMYCRADNLSQNISHTHCEHKAISADLIVTSNNTMSYFLQYCVSLSIYLFIPSYLSRFIFMLHRQIIDPGAKLRDNLALPRTSHLAFSPHGNTLLVQTDKNTMNHEPRCPQQASVDICNLQIYLLLPCQHSPGSYVFIQSVPVTRLWPRYELHCL